MQLLIDNYDSFTYNLYQYLSELGAEVQVHRNDQISLDEIAAMQPDHIIISPGPCTPNEAGLSCRIVETFGPHIPLLGVCLGHQVIGQVYGGRVIQAPKPMHGKTSLVYHQGQGVLHGLPNPFEANRYHSLIIERSTFPSELEITAETVADDVSSANAKTVAADLSSGEHSEDGLVMALRHRTYPIEGVQFHPESIMTPIGKDLLSNFLSRGVQRKVREQ